MTRDELAEGVKKLMINEMKFAPEVVKFVIESKGGQAILDNAMSDENMIHGTAQALVNLPIGNLVMGPQQQIRKPR